MIPKTSIRTLGFRQKLLSSDRVETPGGTVIFGIDPGSYRTGYGVVQVRGQHIKALDYGVVQLRRGASLGVRLREIYLCISNRVSVTQPDEVAVETAFVHRNVATALVLGQARGAALAAALASGCEMYEYAPRAVKLAVVGRGNADKRQIAEMVRRLLNLTGPLEEDASDALAVSLCHAHTSRSMMSIRGIV